jgi:hypothetical protein
MNWFQKIFSRVGAPAGASLAADVAAIKGETATIVAVTNALPEAGALTTIGAAAAAAELAAEAVQAAQADQALEATLTEMKGATWSIETLEAIYNAIVAISGAGAALQEQTPNTDFALAAVDNTLTNPPPAADAANSILALPEVADTTYALRSLFANVTSFGTGTKVTFKLWTMLNNVVTMVDSVDVADLGIQNLMDIFGLPEVHADGIWVTVQTDAGNTGACSGTYCYAKAVTP